MCELWMYGAKTLRLCVLVYVSLRVFIVWFLYNAYKYFMFSSSIYVSTFILENHLRNIVPHTSWHDPPYHRTMKRYADFPSMVIFQLLQLKFWISNMVEKNVNNIFAYFTLSLSTSQVFMVKE